MPEITCPHCGERTAVQESTHDVPSCCQTCDSEIATDFVHFDTGDRPVRGLGTSRITRRSGLKFGAQIVALVIGAGIVVAGAIYAHWILTKGRPNEWVTYFADDGQFQVDFPKGATPSRDEDVVTFEDFPPAKRYSILRIRTHEEYGVSYFELPPEWLPFDETNLESVLDDSLQQIKENPDFLTYTVKSWRTLNVGNQRCRELVLDYQSREGKNGRMWARTLIAGSRFYTLLVFHKDDERPADPERFFSSFVSR